MFVLVIWSTLAWLTKMRFPTLVGEASSHTVQALKQDGQAGTRTGGTGRPVPCNNNKVIKKQIRAVQSKMASNHNVFKCTRRSKKEASSKVKLEQELEELDVLCPYRQGDQEADQGRPSS